MIFNKITISRGSQRIVLLYRDYAIKFPRLYKLQTAMRSNRREHLFSKTGDYRLCPVLFSFPGGIFNVMPRARVMSQCEFAKFDYDSFVGPFMAPTEPKPSSFGFIKGGKWLVALDFG